jgi:transcriptional regulator with XRE-family HTH domain
MSRQSDPGTGLHIAERPRGGERGPGRGTAAAARDLASALPTAEMIKLGRRLVGWSHAELAERCGFSVPTVERLENEPVRTSGAKLDKVRRAFAAAGVSFTRVDGKDCISCRVAPSREAAPTGKAARIARAIPRLAAVGRGECVVIPFPRRRD